MHLKSVAIKRFKRIAHTTFDLDRLNVLVGGNNSGKSTIIQALHFAFTLLQSLDTANKWPIKTKRSSTISPSELIYIPSQDPYSLGHGGKLLEDSDDAIVIELSFTNGDELTLSIRKGRITNILVEPSNVDVARAYSSLDKPFSVFSPGLAGVSRTETLVSNGVLLRALARGDANIVLRNILRRLHSSDKWDDFSGDLSEIFPDARLKITFNEDIDEYINVNATSGTRVIPLDLCGTGLLQAIQILSYFHLFMPKMIVLDEPDSHLHPNNQRLLCSLLSKLSEERQVQVILTTHSRHVLDALYSSSNVLWVNDGDAKVAGKEDHLEVLLSIGALDIKEKVAAGKYDVVFLTEDKLLGFAEAILRSSGFNMDATGLLSYYGVTKVHNLIPIIKHIKDVSNAKIVVHRDRDYLKDDEVSEWRKEVHKLGAEPFVTKSIDIEGYFASEAYLERALPELSTEQLHDVLDRAKSELSETAITDYVNGRVEIERQKGQGAKLNYGLLSTEAHAVTKTDPLAFVKGKKRLARIRSMVKERFDLAIPITDSSAVSDEELVKISKKVFPKLD